MNHKVSLLALLVFVLFNLSGCWNYRELNELALVMAMGIDKAPRGEYETTFQMVNAKETAGPRIPGKTVPITVYSSVGKTLFEAFRKTSQLVPRRINAQHMRILVIGEELAKQGIEEVFDLIERDHELRMTTRVFITRGSDAKSVLKTLTSIENIPANAILGKQKISGKVMGESYEVEIDDVVRGFQIKGGGPVISGIQLIGKDSVGEKKANMEATEIPVKIRTNGMALFKKGKLAGWVKDDAARGITWITNNMKSSIIVLDCEKKKGDISIEILRSSTTVKAQVSEGQPVIHIAVREVGTVGEVMCPIDLNKSTEIQKMENMWNNETKQNVMAAIKIAQKLKTDTLGFGEAVERADPKAWKKMDKEWDRIFATCEVKVKIDSIIKRTGMRTKPFFK